MRLTLADAARFNKVIHHPDIYPDICDDYADPNHTQLGTLLLQVPTIWVVSPNEYVYLMATARTFTLYEVHTMILPEGRGASAVKAVQDAARWFFENSTAEKVITYVPEYNRKARLFAKRVGMKDEGVCTKSFLKGGKLMDQWVLGLEKESICQR